MADTPRTLALTTLAQNYAPEIVRAFNRRATALTVLPIRVGSGKNVGWVAEEDAAVGENFAEGADAANFGSDAQSSATLSWGLYRSNFRVTDLARAAAATSMTPEGNLRLWARDLVNASAKLASTLNGVIYSGAGTGTTYAGLAVAVGNTTNTYATIDRSTDTWWAPTVVDPGSLTAPTFSLIRSDLRTIYTAGGEYPDIALCSPAVFDKLGSLFDSNRRYVDNIRTARGDIKLDASLRAIDIEGCMFLKDKDATANTIYYLNTDYVHVEVLPPSNLPEQVDANVSANDGFGTIPMMFNYQLLAKTGASDKAQVVTQSQLVVTNPVKCGTRKNVATT
ncbi:MAG: phage major capsid protein [Planctomycetota bacterium]|jgi:hypothetical protein